MYLKEIATCKERYTVFIPGHAMAHASGCSRPNTCLPLTPYPHMGHHAATHATTSSFIAHSLQQHEHTTFKGSPPYPRSSKRKKPWQPSAASSRSPTPPSSTPSRSSDRAATPHEPVSSPHDLQGHAIPQYPPIALPHHRGQIWPRSVTPCTIQ
jgi:hypothetical protein